MPDPATLSPIERAARALVATDNRDPDAIHPPGLGRPQWEHAVPYVRAVLTAIREPSIRMIASCHDLDGSQQAIWHRSIDTLLEEGRC